MKSRLWIILFLIILLAVIGCDTKQDESLTIDSKIANPASVYCEEQGHQLEIRTNPDGSQYGICIFPDSSECEEWAYFRGECKPEQEQ